VEEPREGRHLARPGKSLARIAFSERSGTSPVQQTSAAKMLASLRPGDRRKLYGNAALGSASLTWM
jgi:hypothetical protein